MPRLAQIYIRRMRFDEARQTLLREIERHFFAGESEVEIIHGIGDYILRRMAEEELSKLDYVRLDNGYHYNPGSMRVTLLTPERGLLDSYRAES